MKNCKGFTLIEIVILIVILGIGFASLASIYLSAINKSREGEKITMASTCAERIMEEMIFAKEFNDIGSYYGDCNCEDNEILKIFKDCNILPPVYTYCDTNSCKTPPNCPCKQIKLIVTLTDNTKIEIMTNVFNPMFDPNFN